MPRFTPPTAPPSMNCAHADSNAFDVAQSQQPAIAGDETRSTAGDGWPAAAHRAGDQDWSRVARQAVAAGGAAKERRSFAEIVRSGHENVGDTSAGVRSDCALCELSAIENASVRSVLENVFDERAELRQSRAASKSSCATSAGAVNAADDEPGACAGFGGSADRGAGGGGAENGDAGAYARTSAAQFPYAARSTVSPSFDAPTGAFGAPGDGAPPALLDFVCRRAPSELAFVRPAAGHPAPIYPSAAVFVCLRCGEATNLGAYAFQEVAALGDGCRRSRRFRNRGGRTVTHHSRRYNAFGAQPRRFRTPGAGKRKSGHRRADS